MEKKNDIIEKNEEIDPTDDELLTEAEIILSAHERINQDRFQKE